jgi:NAD(P)-dependent dehydrogenase (short-subunit alcohol dehydrogenase family)
MTYAPLSLEGRVAVVVGGTSGIGRALSLGLADAGADVVATGRRADAVASIAADLERRGRRTLRVPTDVTDRASVETLRDEVLAAFGRVDILVNCAGRTKRSPTLDLLEDEWQQILETNLNGTLRACQVFGRPMIAQRYGRIVNIASLASFVAFHEVAAYAASKAAVAALTKSLAVEWAQHGVCINAVAPGIFRTALNAHLLDGSDRGRELLARSPGGRFGEVEEIAGACIFLASEAASFVNGHLLVVDGGFLASGVNQ